MDPENSIFVKNEIELFINLNYLSCLKMKLPCDCLNEINYSLISVDWKANEDLIYEKDSDAGSYLLDTVSDKEFQIQNILNSQKSILTFSENRDTAYLDKNNENSIYARINYKIGLHFNSIMSNVNLNYLMARIINSENFIDELKITESTTFLCYSNIGIINILKNKGQCEDAFIIYNNEESIDIYKYINSCDEKKTEQIIEKKYYKKYPTKS